MNRLSMFKNKFSKGFTLIELLIVIAVIGILAAVVLVAIDPVEQLARGRDAGRKTTVTQFGRALQAYFTVQGSYPTVAGMTNVNATNVLVVTGELKGLPPGTQPVQGVTPCTGGSRIGLGASGDIFCYKVNATFDQSIMYAKVESKSDLNKGACTGPWANVWFVYSTQDGRAGLFLKGAAAEPATGDAPFTFC